MMEKNESIVLKLKMSKIVHISTLFPKYNTVTELSEDPKLAKNKNICVCTLH
jgi:hypothetical protein